MVVEDGDAGAAGGEDKTVADSGKEKITDAQAAAQAVTAGGKAAPDKGDAGKAAADRTVADKGKSLASGADAGTVAVSDWPTDWRERMARDAVSSVDEKDRGKSFDKELKRLARYANPNAVWGKAAELEEKLSDGTRVKVPGPKATDEEVATFNRAMGVPDDPAGYYDKLKLSNNRTLGPNDKPLFDFFAGRLHTVGATPRQVAAVTDAWLDFQQATADTNQELDADFRRDSERALKKDFGGDYSAVTAAMGAMITDYGPEFKAAIDNSRNAEGRILGDDPVFLKAFGKVALALYPADTHRGSEASTTRTSRIDELKAKAATKEGVTSAEREEWTTLLDQEKAVNNRRNKAA